MNRSLISAACGMAFGLLIGIWVICMFVVVPMRLDVRDIRHATVTTTTRKM